MASVFFVAQGGLGNQLFQAAFGIAVEETFGADVCFISDVVTSSDGYGRRYQLDAFPRLKGKTVRMADVAGLPLIVKLGGDRAWLADLLQQHASVVFQGWWQNEQNFLGCDAAIRAAFLAGAYPARAQAAAELRQSGAIGMHVRRFEYGQCGLVTVDYYLKAIETIRREVGPVPVVCFTDEPNFCLNVFRNVANFVIMRPNIEWPVGDLILMSHCRHFVIANSTYSWWAAWLGETEGSIVYSPLPWNGLRPDPTPAPDRWRRIENAVRAP
jgi:hypothetical protein